jgi:hypothetical protein
MSKKLSDTAFWLPNIYGALDQYIELLDRLDQTKDPSHLLPYLDIPEEMRPHFEDLFQRHKLKSISRKPPSYQLSDYLQRLWIAVDHVKSAVRRHEPRDDAIAKAAKDYRVDHRALTSALLGKHRPLRVAQRRSSK